MKKRLQLFISLMALSGLAVSQLPSTANCQMLSGSFIAKSCSLPCCKTQMPMPKCPLLKASASRDLIAISAPILDNTLQPLHDMAGATRSAPQRIALLVADVVESIQAFLLIPAATTRAPPSDIHLLAA